MPGRVYLNLYSRGKAGIPRRNDNEPLFGGAGDSELIVSVCFGASATFRWVRNSDRDWSSGWSQRLSHGDILVMDGKAQDHFEHWTEAGVQEDGLNQHNPGCVSATTGVLCCFPSCAEGLSVHRTPGGLWVEFFPWIGLVLPLWWWRWGVGGSWAPLPAPSPLVCVFFLPQGLSLGLVPYGNYFVRAFPRRELDQAKGKILRVICNKTPFKKRRSPGQCYSRALWWEALSYWL